MVSKLAGRWCIQSEAGEDSACAEVGQKGRIRFNDESDALARFEETKDAGVFAMKSRTGEHLCKARIVEDGEATYLKLEGPDGSDESWRRSTDAPVVRRRPKIGSEAKRAACVEFLKERYNWHREAGNAASDGRFSVQQLAILLRGCGQEVSETDAGLLFQEVDPRGDERVDFHQLIDYVFGLGRTVAARERKARPGTATKGRAARAEQRRQSAKLVRAASEESMVRKSSKGEAGETWEKRRAAEKVAEDEFLTAYKEERQVSEVVAARQEDVRMRMQRTFICGFRDGRLTRAVTALQSKACALRIFTVNDVYELDKLANLKTCIAENRTANQVVILAGDFLAPSLLSSLDHGRSMVDILNRVGLQYVCFGNHEQDVPHKEMLERIKESEFEWIATNMQRLRLAEGMKPLPSHKVLTVKGGEQVRKVGLLGLNTNDAGLYPPGSWGGQGAAVIDPIVDKAIEYRKKLLEEDCCDIVVPMTHQAIALDREMAKKRLGFPLIIGGHDHELYHEEVEGATVIKMGQDAATIGIIDLTWPEAGKAGEAPEITVRKCPAEDFAPDPDIMQRVKVHKRVLDELDRASLFLVPEGVRLSSKKIRVQQVSMGTLLVSSFRNAFNAECAVINAGNIRGNTEYPADLRTFTYSHLKTEMPFDSDVVSIPLPGRVINETVAFTRKWSLETQPVEKGCYMQIDDKMSWDQGTNTVTHINNAPLEPDRVYECVVLWKVAMEGVDGVTPLSEYCKERLGNGSLDSDMSRPAKQVLVNYFGRAVWWHCIQRAGGFDGLDADHDGVISKQELAEALRGSGCFEAEVADIVVQNLMALADLDENGVISKGELLECCLLSKSVFDEMDIDHDHLLSREEAEAFTTKLIGKGVECSSIVDEVFEHVGADKSGQVRASVLKRHCADKAAKI